MVSFVGDAPVASPAIVPIESLEGVSPLKRNFKNFLWKCWRTLGYPDPTRNHYEMADWLQFGPRKSITMGFRGMAKSYVTCCFGLYHLYVDRDGIAVSLSGTTRAAAQNSTFAWQMLSNFDWLAEMVPTSDQRQSGMAFDVRGARPKKMESFRAESIFGQITGMRSTLLLPDDIETPLNSDTEGKRQLLASRHAEAAGAIPLPETQEKMLGTPQNEQSLYADLAHNKGYALRVWPILYPKKDELVKYGSYLAPSIEKAVRDNPSLEDTSTEPTRFSEADILERQIIYGRTEFARQFKLHLDAGAGNAAPLKLRDLLVLEWDAPPPMANSPLLLPADIRWGPTKDKLLQGIEWDCLQGDGLYEAAFVAPPAEWRSVEVTYMYVDPSGEGTDETTATVGHSLAARAFISEQGCWLEGHSHSTLMGIARLAKKWNVQYIYVESNFGQGMFANLLRPCLAEVGHACVIEDDRKAGVQKERRIIETLEPPMSSHRVVINRRLLEADYTVAYDGVEEARRRFYRLTYQLSRITKVRNAIAHDDRSDGLASLVAKFTDLLRQRTQDAEAMDREKKWLEDVQAMIAARQKQGLPTYGAELAIMGLPLGQAHKGGIKSSPLFQGGRDRQANKRSLRG